MIVSMSTPTDARPLTILSRPLRFPRLPRSRQEPSDKFCLLQITIPNLLAYEHSVTAIHNLRTDKRRRNGHILCTPSYLKNRSSKRRENSGKLTQNGPLY